jgi:orotidine-5'-phosphate decarboxylase
VTLYFSEALRRANRERGWLICGLDPVLERIPQHILATHQDGNYHLLFNAQQAIVDFLIPIIDSVSPYVAGFKPNLSFFIDFDDEASGCFWGQQALAAVCRHIKKNYPEHVLILDSKDGDIGASNDGYFKRASGYGAHAVTWNPYLGPATRDQMKKWPHLGLIVLARTSNKEGTILQTGKLTNGSPVYEEVLKEWRIVRMTGGQIGFVAGATHPDDLRKIRKYVGATPLLVPGVGKQGGDAGTVLKAGFGGRHGALMVNVSSDILYADSGKGFALEAKTKAMCLKTELDQAFTDIRNKM